MMMEEKEKNNRIQEMVKDLQSKNDRKVIGALKRVPHEGAPEMIAPMFVLYNDHPSKEIRILLEKTLFNLKDPNCIPAMVAILRDPNRSDQHQAVLSSMWQSGFEMSGELELLVDIAIQGDFMMAVEAVTIIEQSEFNDDETLTNAISKMDDAVELKNEKQDLMVSLRQLLLDKLLGEQ